MEVTSSAWTTIFFLLLNSSPSTPAIPSGNIRLQSPTVTNWGDWGPIEKCPNGTYVNGVQLKVEPKQAPLHDDTGLNGIRFFCADLTGKPTETPLPVIQSTVGPWGSWRSEFFCNNGLVVGFQLRSEPEQRKHDDTAANNLRVLCSDGQEIEGEGTSWGEWTPVQKCRKRQAICSLQTQVEMGQGVGDDSALNNLRVECCDIPNPAENCTPTDFWELIAECDNTNAFTPTTCSYERKIGMAYSSAQNANAESSGQEKSFLDSIGFNIGLEAQVLSKKFQFETGIGETTGYNWKSSKTDTWNHESTTKVAFDVPPGVRSSMVQVVGACGNYLVRTAKFQRIDKLGSASGAETATMTSTTIPQGLEAFYRN